MIHKTTTSNIFLFRKDLRIEDNPALLEAFKENIPLILLYIFDHKVLTLGINSCAFTCNVINQLCKDLNGNLFIREGNTEDVLNVLVEQYNVKTIFVNSNSDPSLTSSLILKREKLMSKLVVVNDEVLNFSLINVARSKPYEKFTYFYKKILKTCAFIPSLEYTLSIEELLSKLVKPQIYEQADINPPVSLIDVAYLYPNTNEKAVFAQLFDWYAYSLHKYGSKSKDLSSDSSSKTSHLIAVGVLSKRKLIELNSFERLKSSNILTSKLHMEDQPAIHQKRIAGCDRLIRNILWNEFCRYIHKHHPNMSQQCIVPLKNELLFEQNKFITWCQANTGCSIVDIAINHLIGTGSIPNALRMIAASYLVNIYEIPWQHGAQFFKEHLIDADESSNSFNWQFLAKTLSSNSIRSITRFDNKDQIMDPNNKFKGLSIYLAQKSNIQKYKSDLNSGIIHLDCN
jgi:deoxyribodipyrimidine photo-lyase